MTAITTDLPRASYERLEAADDGQRGLLDCMLKDACAWLEIPIDACPSCRGAPDVCEDHESAMERIRDYAGIEIYLDSIESERFRKPLLLIADQIRVIAEALPNAIAFRDRGHALEDLALGAAYRELQRHLVQG